MSTHDPISDLITRIRNAQMRSKSKVSSPGSKMRQNVLEVLKSEGYIRGYATRRAFLGPQRARDRAEIFRRRAGHPRDRAGLQAGAPGLRLGEEPAAGQQRPWHFGVVDAEGNHGRPRRARRECGRRSSLHRVLGGSEGSEERIRAHVTHWQTACDDPVGCDGDCRGPDGEDEGAERPASVRRP